MLQLRTLRVRQQQPATLVSCSAEITRFRPSRGAGHRHGDGQYRWPPCVTPLDLPGKDVQPPVCEVSVMIGRRYAPKARAAIVYWGGMEWPEIYVRLTRDRNDVAARQAPRALRPLLGTTGSGLPRPGGRSYRSASCPDVASRRPRATRLGPSGRVAR